MIRRIDRYYLRDINHNNSYNIEQNTRPVYPLSLLVQAYTVCMCITACSDPSLLLSPHSLKKTCLLVYYCVMGEMNRSSPLVGRVSTHVKSRPVPWFVPRSGSVFRYSHFPSPVPSRNTMMVDLYMLSIPIRLLLRSDESGFVGLCVQ